MKLSMHDFDAYEICNEEDSVIIINHDQDCVIADGCHYCIQYIVITGSMEQENGACAALLNI